MDIAELLAFTVHQQASDLHLSAGLPRTLRVAATFARSKSTRLNSSHT